MTPSLTTPALDELVFGFLRENYPDTRDRYATMKGSTQHIHYALLTSDFFLAEHILYLFEAMGADASGYVIYQIVQHLPDNAVPSPHLRGILGQVFAKPPHLVMGASTLYCCESPTPDRLEAVTHNYLFKRKLALLQQ